MTYGEGEPFELRKDESPAVHYLGQHRIFDPPARSVSDEEVMAAIECLSERYRDTLIALAEYFKCPARSAESATHEPDK